MSSVLSSSLEVRQQSHIVEDTAKGGDIQREVGVGLCSGRKGKGAQFSWRVRLVFSLSCSLSVLSALLCIAFGSAGPYARNV